MIIVIVVIGIIGSMAATMLFQGAKTFVGETDRQGFVSESRSAFWRIMRDTQGQASPIDFASSSQNILYLKNGKNEQKDFQIGSTGFLYLRHGAEDLGRRILQRLASPLWKHLASTTVDKDSLHIAL